MGRPRKNPLPEESGISGNVSEKSEQPKVEMPQDRISALEALINKQGSQIETLTDALKQSKINKPKRIEEREVSVMFMDDKAVVDWKDVKSINGQDMWPVVLMDIEGNEDVDLIPYLQALNTNHRFKAIIIEQKATEKEIHQGDVPREVNTQTFDPVGLKEGGRQFESQRIVLTQTIVVYKAKIKFISGPWEGKEITVDTKCFNP